MDVAFYRKIAGITRRTSWPALAAAFLNGKLYSRTGRRMARRFRIGTRTGNIVLSPEPGWKEILSFWHEITVEQPYQHLHGCAGGATHLLDCGANAGAFLISTLRRFPHLNGTGFEPHPETHRRLMDNLAANALGPRATAPHAAIGAARGTVEFTAYNGTTMAQSAETPVKLDGFAAAGTFSVEQLRLDDWLSAEHAAGRRPQCLLKVDVEGFEVEVLKGAPETLRHTVAVSMETHTPALTAACREILEETGFKVTTTPWHGPEMAILNAVR
jgi:FkbM family methyltransferase